jgi:uncharacterized protein
MAVELVRVPAGVDLELDVQLEGVTEGVLVTATVSAPLAGECARCLELFELARDPEPGDDPDGTDSYRLDASGLLDLEPALRDALVLELPLSPLCEDDCQGLCVECGIRLADAEPGHRHEQRGTMWAALQDFRADEPNGHQPDGGPHEEEVPDPAAGPAMTTHRTDAAPGQAKEH